MNRQLPFPAAIGATSIDIRRAAVLGAGSMGSGIAAQFANAGIPVDLIDIASAESSSRSAAAEAGVARQLKAGGFMHDEAAGLVRTGNIEDNLDWLADADWIVEAVIEDLDAKRELYRKIDATRKRGSIVSSNTSTIPRADLIAGMPRGFAADFLITHFFNPPRVMPLVEIIAGPQNAAATLTHVSQAAEILLGKTVVECRDTPGFIANRIGCFWIAAGILEAHRLGLDVEAADAVNAAFGIPRTGVFGLIDLVGIDLVPHVWGSLMEALPPTDDIHRADLPGDNLIRSMIARGQFGRKAKAGFYRVTADRRREVIDLSSGDYRPEHPVSASDLPGGGRDIAALVDASDHHGVYAWQLFSRVLTYAATHAGAIAADVGAIDRAIALGYAWQQGPFALADRYGVGRIVARLEAEGRQVPALLRAAASAGFFRADGQPLDSQGSHHAAPPQRSGVAAFRQGNPPIFSNDTASVWDLGDGIACFEMRTKLNAFAPAVFDVLERLVDQGASRFSGLVLGNDDPRAFSAGADLAFFASLIRKQDWAAIDAYIARGQRAFLGLKYSDFPVVAAAHGFALGGGCELMLHADAIVAHAELNAGLPEIKVGLVPGWGGCTLLLQRAQTNRSTDPKGPAATANFAFERIFAGNPSGSALEARASKLLQPEDGIVMARSRLIGAAKAKALDLLASGYHPPAQARLVLPGRSGKQAIMNMVAGERAAGRLTDNDVRYADALAHVLTGGASADPMVAIADTALMDLERQTLLELIRTPATIDRIDHMLATGKPLRN